MDLQWMTCYAALTSRQIIWSITMKKKNLQEFSRFMVDKYHLPHVPRVVPQSIQATLAFFVRIFHPFVHPLR